WRGHVPLQGQQRHDPHRCPALLDPQAAQLGRGAQDRHRLVGSAPADRSQDAPARRAFGRMSRDDHIDEFEIDGVGFRLRPLPALVAEKLAPAVAALVTPALAGIIANQSDVTELAKALRTLEGALEQLPKFREAFAAQCQVTLPERAGGELVWTELKGKVFDETF